MYYASLWQNVTITSSSFVLYVSAYQSLADNYLSLCRGMTAVSLCSMPLYNLPCQILNSHWQKIFLYVALTQS